MACGQAIQARAVEGVGFQEFKATGLCVDYRPLRLSYFQHGEGLPAAIEAVADEVDSTPGAGQHLGVDAAQFARRSGAPSGQARDLPVAFGPSHHKIALQRQSLGAGSVDVASVGVTAPERN